MARRGADFGVVPPGDVKMDMKRVKARMREISGASNKGLTSWLEGMENASLIRGHARFISPDTLSVNDEEITAEKIFINVGTRASVPDLEGIRDVDYLTNSSLLEAEFLPEHLVIVGGSYIGLEFGQMYRRFGSNVTIVERGDRLIKREDEDVSAGVKEILEKEGIEVRLNAECLKLERRGNGVAVGTSCREGDPMVQGSHVLLAVGRRPNTDDLGLEKAGIEVDARGYIKVDETLRTNVPGVWALGDVNGRGGFTHTSYNDYEIAVANVLEGDPRKVSDRIPCYALYIDPPLGRIGMTEREVRQSGRPALIGTRPMKRVGRAFERSETDGFMKILVGADSKKILGASILGIGGDEVVHTLLATMYAGAPYTSISRAVYIHPTVSELLPTVLQGLKPLA